jgi:hypothetical protein
LNDFIQFSTNGNTEHMRITSAGKVFIGDTTASNAQLRVKQSTSGEWAANIINHQSVAYGLSIDTSSAASTATYNFAAYTPAGTGFFLQNTGNVGIGIASPARKLDVQGPSDSNDVIAIRHASGGSSWLKLGFWNGTTERASIRTQDDNSHLSFFAGTSERMRILSSGYVGIGTSAPGYLLQVQGNSYFTDLITTGQLGIKLYSGWGGVGTTYSGGQLFVGFNVKTTGSGDTVQASNTHAGGAGWAHMKCTGYGTGITFHTKSGNTTAGESATSNVRMQIYGNGSISMGGALTVGGTITENSSIAIKENIFDFNTTLDKINRVRPVRYNKKKSKNKKEIGFIAEELAEIFPELVENDENGNPTSVNYTRAVTVLFDGFKQMYKELKEIKEKIK